MRIDVVSIFPDYLEPLRLSLVGKAIESGRVQLGVHDLRSWTRDRHRTVDDTPYGGGAGMVMKPDAWGEALDALATADTRLMMLTPSGRRFTQRIADELAAEEHLILASGRYEGIDARVVEYARTRMRVDEISIGDYVLNGGEAAALVVIEAVVRLIPGVIGNPASLAEESHSAGQEGLLEYPVYTKPPSWRGLDVPEILFSGHHNEIARWRRRQALDRTRQRRPDLLPAVPGAPVITEAVAGDAGEIWTVQQAAFLSEGRLNGSYDLPPLTQTLAELEASLSQGLVLVARRKGRLIGSVRAEVSSNGFWFIGRLMVAPDLQRQGIGRQLMDAIEARTPPQALGCQLCTGGLSVRNLAFYRRRGYVEVQRSTDPAGVAVVVMERPLSR